MPKTLRNKYYENLSFGKLMEAHKKARRGKGLRKEIIKFNLKQEEYIYYLLEVLSNKTYKHGGYEVFYVTEPKLRKIEKSRYIDRVVHRWLVDNFLEPYFVPSFINTSYACIKGRGIHKACLDVQKAMRSCKNKWSSYYILKMDISKYFENIDKRILLSILEKKILDKDVMWLIKEILYSQRKEVGAVGAKLLYPDDTVQHAGVVVGYKGYATHAYTEIDKDDFGHMGRPRVSSNYSAVTAACLMVRKEIYDKVGGFDEQFKVACNDVDFCLKIRELGLFNVFNAFSLWHHFESKTRGYEDTPEKLERFNNEIKKFQKKWPYILKNGDPFHNINFDLDKGPFKLY